MHGNLENQKAIDDKRNWHFKKKHIVAFVFLLPAIISFLATKYYPILNGVYLSFFKFNPRNMPGIFCGFDNYIRALHDIEFYNAFLHNIYFLVLGLLFGFWPPILCALLINEVRKYKGLVRILYYIPAVTPAIAGAVIWKYMWNPDYGFFNYLMRLLNLPPQMWLNDPNLVYWCMCAPGMLSAGGMTMLIYLAAMQDVSDEHYEAALLEGAGIRQRIWYITIPTIKPIIKIMFILGVIGSFNAYEGQLVMTGGGPVGSTTTLILYAYNKAVNFGDYTYSITISMLTAIFVFMLTAIQMYTKKKKGES